MSRQKLPIDPAKVQELAGYGLTQADIARKLGCSERTLSRRFAGEIQYGIADARMSLRAIMWAEARKSNTGIILRLDDRYFGPLPKVVQTDQGEVLEALSDGHDKDTVPGGEHQGPAIEPA